MKKKLKTVYEIAIAVLAFISVTFVILDLCSIIDLKLKPYNIIDNSILIIFTVDYVVRFIKSKDKWYFFKHNIFDLIAIIPFDSALSIFRFSRFFRIARMARFTRLLKLTKLFRLIGFTGVLKKRMNKFLKTNGFIYVLYTSVALIIISSIVMSRLENKTFWDALWWSIVTCTTVGYGDISPVTPAGRIIAIILMLFGIGLIGMLTSTITTYFTNLNNTRNNRESSQDCSVLIDAAETLSKEQIETLTSIAKSMKSGTINIKLDNELSYK